MKLTKFLAGWMAMVAIGALAQGTPVVTSKINNAIFLVGTTPYTTIHSAITAGCASTASTNPQHTAATGVVIVPVGVTASDAITAATGCAGTTVVDQRVVPNVCYAWTGAGPYAVTNCSSGIPAGKTLNGTGSGIPTQTGSYLADDLAFYKTTAGDLYDSGVSFDSSAFSSSVNEYLYTQFGGKKIYGTSGITPSCDDYTKANCLLHFINYVNACSTPATATAVTGTTVTVSNIACFPTNGILVSNLGPGCYLGWRGIVGNVLQNTSGNFGWGQSSCGVSVGTALYSVNEAIASTTATAPVTYSLASPGGYFVTGYPSSSGIGLYPNGASGQANYQGSVNYNTVILQPPFPNPASNGISNGRFSNLYRGGYSTTACATVDYISNDNLATMGVAYANSHCVLATDGLNAGDMAWGRTTTSGTLLPGSIFWRIDTSNNSYYYNQTPATSGANQSSPTHNESGNYWTGSVTAEDRWTRQVVLGAGSNPSSTYKFTHTGSTGPAAVEAPAVNVVSAQTTVSCSTSGTAIFTEPLTGASLKTVMVYENACVGTAAYTYPVAYTFAPQVISQSLTSTASVTTTAVTITGVTSTGFVELNGW